MTFSPFANFENGFHWICVNEINYPVLKIYLVAIGRIIFLGEITHVFNIFSNYFSKLFTLKII